MQEAQDELPPDLLELGDDILLVRPEAAPPNPLPNRAPSQHRQAFDPRLGKTREDFRKAMETELQAALLRVEDKVRAKTGAVGLEQLIPTVRVEVRIKPKRGSSRVYEKIVNVILSPEGAAATQKSIREKVQEAFPSHAIPKDWTQPLPRWAITKIKARISNRGGPFASMAIPSKVSLSKLHKLAKAALQRHETGAFTAKATISLTNDAVIINNTPFKVTKNRVGKRDYPMVRISIDNLQQVLGSK
jgi:hypothetical protein